MQPACRWIQAEAGAVLHWHYACIASVRRRADYFETCVEWQGHEHVSRAGSLRQGIRYVTRWVEVGRVVDPEFMAAYIACWTRRHDAA